jgi:acylglycerol lipase
LTLSRNSYQSLRDADQVALPSPETIRAGDGIVLAYRRFVPPTPRAAVLFYHGGGAHGGAGYQHLGHGLCSAYQVAVYLPDLRGHGASEGPRGDGPSRGRIWEDVTTLLRRVRVECPDVPVFLGGHSSGAGLVLNYVTSMRNDPVDGYAFVAPNLGFRSKTERLPSGAPFALASVPPFVLHAVSGGLLCGHRHAVRFHYPPEVLGHDPSMVTSYSVNMANAVTPSAPRCQLESLTRPFGLWIGTDDELLDANAVVAFADAAKDVRAVSEVQQVPEATHLSILLEAHHLVGPWVTRDT